MSLGDLVGGNTYGFDFALDGSLYLVGGVYEPRLTRWDPTVFGDSTRMLEDMEGLIGSLSMGQLGVVAKYAVHVGRRNFHI